MKRLEMQHLTSIKNYLKPAQASSSQLSASITEETSTSTITTLNEQSTTNELNNPINGVEVKTRLNKSLNESSKRISNLLQFRNAFSTSATNNSTTTSTDLIDHNKEIIVQKTKFHRTSSIGVSIKSKQKRQNSITAASATIKQKYFSLNTSESISKKQLLQQNNLDSESIFAWLNTDLDELIKHFQQSQPNLNDDFYYNNELTFLETSDASSITYYQLASYAKHLMSRCLDVYKLIEANVHLYDYQYKSNNEEINDNNNGFSIRSNGYRSLLKVFDSCCRRLLIVVSDLNEKKNRFLFQIKLNNNLLPMAINSSLKDFQTWVKLMEKIEIILQIAVDMQKITRNDVKDDAAPSLFLKANQFTNTSIESNLFNLGSIHQEAFFGRACGFQFCDSLQIPLTGCAVALASYNDGYEAFLSPSTVTLNPTPVNAIKDTPSSINAPSNTLLTTNTNSSSVNNSVLNSSNIPGYSFSNTIGQAAMSVFSSTKYIMDPDSRAKKIAQVMRNANVEFCKAFWQLTETSIVQMGSNLVTPNLAFNVVKKICISNPLKLNRVTSNAQDGTAINEDDFVEILPPSGTLPGDTIKIRILSSEMRKGMQNLDKLTTIEAPVAFNNYNQLSSFNEENLKSVSKCLILHVHGGGFIAHSSKSHEIYLKPWCKELKVPIVSIDYSLAPEHAFPRASEECFYVYAWCLLNKHLLGWTGEKIICVGDSAGGVLVTNIVQRAINNQIRVPDALVPIYTPFLLTYSLSPSRLLSLMDPLLNLGILWRCLAAYVGIDFKTENEYYKTILNLDQNKSSSSKTSSKSNSKPSSKSSSPTTPSPSITDKLAKLKSIGSQFSIKYSKNDPLNENEISIDQDKVALKNNQVPNDSPQDSESDNIKPNTSIGNFDDAIEKQRLRKLHKLMGDSVFLIEKLRHNEQTFDQYMSPLLSEDSVLEKFPKTYLIASADPFLDDNIEMANRLKKLKCNFELMVVDNGTPHGFLNMQSLSEETHSALVESTHTIKHIIEEFDPVLYQQVKN